MLKLNSNRGFTDPEGTGSVIPRQVAWVAWMDQFSDSPLDLFQVRLSGRAAPSNRVLSLAPAQRPGMTIQPGSDGEYPIGDDALDWLGGGFGQTTSTASETSGEVVLTVRRASPDNPAPLCVLTDSNAASVLVSASTGPLGLDIGPENHGQEMSDGPFPHHGVTESAHDKS